MKNKNSGGTIVFLWVFALILTIGLMTKGISRFNTEQVVATVSEKGERCASRDSCKYLIYTDKGVYQNTDALLYWKWDSADVYNNLKVGSTYSFKVAGFRVPFLSWYPNVVEYKEVE